MDRLNWSILVRRIRSSRSKRALFFKPVCLIAAIDLADEGRIDPMNVNGKAIAERFSDYVTPFMPDRGSEGFQPLWYLSSNGLWSFFKDGQILTKKDLKYGRLYTSAQLFETSNRLVMNFEWRALWEDAGARKTLRDAMLLMLEDSDSDSQRLVEPLFDPKNLLTPQRWPTASFLRDHFKTMRDQLSLFEDEPPSTRDIRPSRTSKAHAPRESQSLEAIAHVPSPVDYRWVRSRIFVGPNSANLPLLPQATSAKTHAERLEACAQQAADLLSDLQRQVWQVRSEYAVHLGRYMDRLPADGSEGNILLADAAARILREMFAAEQNELPPPFSAALKILLQQHIALRPYYPELAAFIRAAQDGRINEPLPLDAIAEVISAVRAHTPVIFDASVSTALGETSSAEPVVPPSEASAQGDIIAPPPDPMGDVEPSKAHDLQVAGAINQLWKVFRMGETIHAATDAWIAAYHALSGPICQVLAWLGPFLGL